jgi:hypothetical protein
MFSVGASLRRVPLSIPITAENSVVTPTRSKCPRLLFSFKTGAPPSSYNSREAHQSQRRNYDVGTVTMKLVQVLNVCLGLLSVYCCTHHSGLVFKASDAHLGNC